jgi:hypothetical protein
VSVLASVAVESDGGSSRRLGTDRRGVPGGLLGGDEYLAGLGDRHISVAGASPSSSVASNTSTHRATTVSDASRASLVRSCGDRVTVAAQAACDGHDGQMRRFVREHSLSIVTFVVFLVIWLGGQTWAGHRSFNEEQRAHGDPTVSFSEYVTQAHFGEATFENWESEFLQMGVYVLLTAWLVQKGSAESKAPDGDPTVEADPRGHRNDPDVPWPVRRGGWVLRVYENSLGIVMLGLFVLALVGHVVTGAHAYNAEQVAHDGPTISTWAYLFRSQFWFESLQNWQSEFLAVGSLVVLSVFLRQRGSPESKPVHAPHTRTGTP